MARVDVRSAAILLVGLGLAATASRPQQAAAQVSHWQQLRPSGLAPQALQWPAEAYDPVGHRMILFGGTDQTVDFNDVWALRLDAGQEAWAKLRPYGQAPTARRGAAAAFDPASNRYVLFGGFSDVRSVYWDDTWLVDLATGDGRWVKHDPAAPHPPGRREPTLVYQHLDGPEPVERLILFGGYNATFDFNDVWAFDLRPGQEGWTQLSPCGTKPGQRDGHAAVYDAAHQRMIVYGGWDRRPTLRTIGDTWALDLTPGAECWSELRPDGTTIPSMGWSSAVYDACPGQERDLIFGGFNNSANRSSSDVWSLTLEPRAEVMSRLEVTGARPRPRDSHAAVYDPRGRRMIIYSGWDGPGDLLRDVWALDLTVCDTLVPTATLTAVPPIGPTSTPTAEVTGTETMPVPTPSPSPSPTATPIESTPTPGSCADTDEPNDEWNQAKLLEVGQLQTHRFSRPGDVDFVKLVAEAGRRYRIRTLDLAPEVDTRLYLYDTDGQSLLTWNDDDPASAPASVIDWTCPAAGSYFLKVTNLDPAAGGCSLTYAIQAVADGAPTPTPTEPPSAHTIYLPLAHNGALPGLPPPLPALVCNPGFESGRLDEGAIRWALSPAPAAKLDGTLRLTLAMLHGGQARPSGPTTLPAPLSASGFARVYPHTPIRVLVTTSDAGALRRLGARVHAAVGHIVVAEVAAGRLDDLARLPSVQRIEVPREATPNNDLAGADIRLPAAFARSGTRGAGVIVGLIDSGIDFTHPSFIDAVGRTRIRALLDLGMPGDVDADGDFDGPGPGGGTLYLEDDINRALEAEASGRSRLYAVGAVAAIPDGASVESVLDIPADDAVTIETLHLRLVYSHWRLNDVAITLVAPDGSPHSILRPTAPVDTSLTAVYELSSLAGRSTSGRWSLHVRDENADGLGGTLRNWRLIINRPVPLDDFTGHGTYVAGSAVGDDAAVGEPAPGPFAGTAPEADILVVRGYRQATTILDDDTILGMQWIDQVATSRSQPYVINISHATVLGAHDGTSPVERAIDALVGPGKPGRAVVVSLGSSGARRAHAGGAFGLGTDAVDLAIAAGVTEVRLGIALDETAGATFGIEFPGGPDVVCTTADERGQDVRSDCGRMAVAPGDPWRMIVLQRGQDVLNRGWLLWSGGQSGGAQQVELLMSAEAAPAVLEGAWRLRLEGARGRWDAWATAGEPFVNGDNRMTVMVPGTARNAITAGNHATRVEWTDATGARQTEPGQPGALAPSSSRGPTRDGRTKPDLTAPGEWIIGARAGRMTVTNRSRISDRHRIAGGTSQSGAIVSGAVALLLSLPEGRTWDAQRLRDLLQASARRDAFTGAQPDPNAWGMGKLDLLAAMELALPEPRPSPSSMPTATPTVTPTVPRPTPTPTATDRPPGACWQSGGELPASVVRELDDGLLPLAGQFAAVLGDPASGDGRPGGRPVPSGSAWIEQTVAVPNTAAPLLQFGYRLVTYDVAADDLGRARDAFRVEIDGQEAFQDGNRDTTVPGARYAIGWRNAQVDLSPWRGRTVVLRLANWNGRDPAAGAEAYNTWTYVDAVMILP